MRILSEKDYAFLKKRKRLVAMWNTVAVVILIALAALFLWLFDQSPYFANPLYVVESIKQNSIDESMMIMATTLLPIVDMVLFITVAIFILFGFSIFSNEKRYLSMIDNLLNEKSKN